MTKKVDQSDTAIELRMSDVLSDRLLERRNGEIAGLMRLLLSTKLKELLYRSAQVIRCGGSEIDGTPPSPKA